MKGSPPQSDASSETNPHPLADYRSNEEWQDLVAQTGSLLAALDNIKDEDTKKQVFAALGGIDTLHREALHRLVKLFKEGVLEQVITDPAINTLMGMYDLIPPDANSDQPIAQPLEHAAAQSVSFYPTGELPVFSDTLPSNEPAHWSPAPLAEPPKEGTAFICEMEEGALLITNIEGRDVALDATCPTHGKQMTNGTLDGLSWICPHGPGCSYDLRNGAKLGGGTGLQCYAIRTDSGRLMIGFGVPFEPIMSSF